MGGQISSSGSGENFNLTTSRSSSSSFKNCSSSSSSSSAGGFLTSPGLSSLGSSGRKSRHWRTPSSCSNSASPPPPLLTTNDNNNNIFLNNNYSSSSSFSSAGCTPYLSEQQQKFNIRHPSLSSSIIRSSVPKVRQQKTNNNNNTQWKALPSSSPFIENLNEKFVSSKNRLFSHQANSMFGYYKSQNCSNGSRNSTGSTRKNINNATSTTTLVNRLSGSFTRRALPGGGGIMVNKENIDEGKIIIKEQNGQKQRHLYLNKREEEEDEKQKIIDENDDNIYNDLANLNISNSHQQKKEDEIIHWRKKKNLENNNSSSKDFSSTLKSSLKRSGSKLFNGIIRGGGYIKNLIGEDYNDDNEEDEEKEEFIDNEEKDEEGQFNNLKIHNVDFLDNNNNKTTNIDLSNFNNKLQKSTTTISTSSLRASLRQAKKKMMTKCVASSTTGGSRRQRNGNIEVYLNKRGDGELVSSMLLAMATNCPSSSINNKTTNSRRPFSAPTDANNNNYSSIINNNCIKTTKDLWFSSDWSCNERNIDKNNFFDNLSTPIKQRRKIIQANSGELIKAIGHFIYQNCCWSGLHEQFEPSHLGTWLRSVDRALILQGWQDVAFINPANLVFLFMLIRDAYLQGEFKKLFSLEDLHSFVLMCLYISYSYMGNEISYPLKPFITENADRSLFWSKCVKLIKIHSSQMLRLNASSSLFLEVFTELKTYCIPRQLNNNKNEWLINE